MNYLKIHAFAIIPFHRATLKDIVHGRKCDRISGFLDDKYHINLCCFPWFMFTICLKQRFLCHKPQKTTKMGLFTVNFCAVRHEHIQKKLYCFYVKSHFRVVFYLHVVGSLNDGIELAHQKNDVKVFIQFFNCTPCLLTVYLPNGMDSRSANCHHYMRVVVKECVLYAYHAMIGYHRLEVVVQQIGMIVNAYIFKFGMSMQN